MTSLSVTKTLASILAALIFAFSVWQVSSAVLRLQSVTSDISNLQNQSNDQPNINPTQWVIEANSHGAAGASLQARLRVSARASDTSLTRIEIQPPNDAAPSEVRASAQASGDIRAIANFIYTLESETPALVIERIRINTSSLGVLELDLVLLARMNIRGEQ